MERTDVVVIGAGYAGLCAGRALQRAGVGVAVLEARDRVAGRVQTERATGEMALDLGGQWIGPGHDRLAALARETGAATFPALVAGDSLFVDGADPRRFRGTLPPVAPHATAVLALALLRLDRLAARIDLERPWAAPGAERHDAMTVATWLRRNVPVAVSRRLLELALRDELSAEVGSVSLLSLLTSIRSAGGMAGQMAIEVGAQQSLFVEGADGPARSLAAELGEAVRLGAAVTAVRQDGRGVTVTGPGVELRCERVVVAMAPPLAGRIAYDPALPAQRDQLTQRMPMGSVLKMIAVYERPFWCEDGLSGEVVDLRGPVPAVFGIAHPGGAGYLCALVPARAAQRLADLGARRRRQLVLEEFRRFFGPKATRPVDWREKLWADDPWSRGGYGTILPPGVLTSVGAALREPVGRIHWAGSETATAWAGYIEGAVRSGERVADEVRQALQVLEPT